ncbi:hypothetical protein OH76DRAFT_61730 [Lentinus brumalis]|uniref:Uncharacterized protein n=1 Tax=Lentinus brumalis TaxID=2498619 RepID=A0A371DKD9_9APHY|nr:hypothetical protein OH76DRAFT_61730 [Polyporus brumalis]
MPRLSRLLRRLRTALGMSSLPHSGHGYVVCVPVESLRCRLYATLQMQNSKGQSACEVASDLQISCVGKDSAVLQGLLDSGDYYKGPSGQSPCVCNTVMYSLIAGCQLCQYDVPSALLAWSVYASNCTDRTNGSYPNSVPSGTAIPAWAYQDVMI